jgi:hypothetical protein
MFYNYDNSEVTTAQNLWATYQAPGAARFVNGAVFAMPIGDKIYGSDHTMLKDGRVYFLIANVWLPVDNDQLVWVWMEA